MVVEHMRGAEGGRQDSLSVWFVVTASTIGVVLC